MKKTILLEMYLRENLGDDMFLDIISKKYPSVEFIITGNISDAYDDKFPNVKIYRYTGIKKYLDKFFRNICKRDVFFDREQKKVDGVIILGGSVFIENADKLEILYKMRKKSIKYGKPYFVIGSNFGPFYDDEFRLKYLRLFAKCKDVCFRDSISAKFFESLKSVRFAPDVIFNYSQDKKNIIPKTVGISVIDLGDSSHKNICDMKEKYEFKIQTIIQELINKNYKVNLYSFCENQGDCDAINRIVNNVTNHGNKLEVVSYSNINIQEFNDSFASNEYIVATRFHSMILGLKNGQKVLPIIYDEKMTNVIKDLHISNYYTMDSLDSFTCEKLLEIKKVQNIENVIKNSAMQFDGLNKFLS